MSNHWSKSAALVRTAKEMPIGEVIDRIGALNRGIAKFWSNSNGWAPVDAAGLLGKSRLDWQVSFSASLHLWVREPATVLTPAELILAWTNLGTLIEGTIKTLLSVWYEDYKADIDNLKKAQAFNNKKQAAHDPDGLRLEQLRKYCIAKDLLDPEGDQLVDLVQQRRNAIHAFKDRSIGDDTEFQNAVRSYLELLRMVNALLPYPDKMYEPQEI